MALSKSDIKNLINQLIQDNGRTNIEEIHLKLGENGHFFDSEYLSTILREMLDDLDIMSLNADDFLFIPSGGPGGTLDLTNVITNILPSAGYNLTIGDDDQVWEEIHGEVFHIYDGVGDSGMIRYYNGDYQAYVNGNWVSILGSSTSTNQVSVIISGERDMFSTNLYMNGPHGNSMYDVPFIIPYDGLLKYISASAANIASWTAEVHLNGSSVVNASVDVNSNYSGYSEITPGIPFSAGDKIQLYCNGNNIFKPRIDAVFTNYVGVETEASIVISGERDKNSSDIYMNGPHGNSMYQVPFILPYNGVLKYLSASGASIQTWVAEVHVNGVPVSNADLSIVSDYSAYREFATPIPFSAGDKIQLYCRGSSINKPRIDAVFARII